MKPISDTAFYCCGIRMLDARSSKPICGDRYAATFMDEHGMEVFRRFGAELGPNAGNVARHRFIDDYLRAKLAANPALRVILIGCGFDSRAFRLNGGQWVELDEPQLILYKNQKLPPQDCPNPLERIGIDFAGEALADKLAAFAGPQPTVFVIEGVTMYLPDGVLDATLDTLRRLFAQHEVIADLMTRRFLERYGRNIKRIITQMGATLVPVDDPGLAFQRCGYREILRQSVALKTFDYRGLAVLGAIFRVLLPGAVSGYMLRVFTPADR